MEKIKLHWKKIFLFVIVILIAAFCIFAYKIFKSHSAKSATAGTVIKNLFSCAKEGETIGNPTMPSRCCGELKAVSGIGDYAGDCSASYAPPGGLSFCSNCGDAVCNSYVGEDKCNCPKDCEVKDGKIIEKCAGFGQQIDGERKSCCPPLKSVKPYSYNDDCSEKTGDFASNIEICTTCGDGKCNGVENKCNCLEDCK